MRIQKIVFVVIYDHAAKYAPWFPDLSGEPEFVEVKAGKKYQWSGIKLFPETIRRNLILKKALLTLDKIVHSRLKD